MSKNPTAWIVSSGSEIVQGLYADTNSRDISGRLISEGFRVIGHSAAPDDPARITAALDHASRAADLTVVSGGLGPTEDDVNRDVIARLWCVELRRHATALQVLNRRFAASGMTVSASNLRQADLPEGAEILTNHWGTAPGFFLPASGGRGALIALPGPPSECLPMLDRAIARHFARWFPTRAHHALRAMHLMMTPESWVNEAIGDLFANDPAADVTILAGRGHVRVRVLARGDSEEHAAARADALIREVRARVGPEVIFSADPDATPQGALVALLGGMGLTLALAESCTGGLVAKMITDVAGSSAVLLAGWVTYSNEAKARDIGVDPELIARHGAVSEEVVRAMAEGARARAGADLAAAVSGIAGPGGGTAEKPVGTVWFAVAGEHETHAVRRRFPGDRATVREFAAHQTLELIRRHVAGIDPDVAVNGTAGVRRR